MSAEPTTTPLAGASAHPIAEDDPRRLTLLASSDVIVWSIEPDGGPSSPHPSWEAYTGQVWDEYRGAGWTEALHPQDRPRILEALKQAIEQRKSYRAECRIWHAGSGTHRRCVTRAVPIVGRDGKVAEWVGGVADVDEPPIGVPELSRLNDTLKSQLRAQNEELQRLFCVSLDVLLTLDKDGRIVSVSPSAEAVTGLAHADIVGKPFDCLIHPDDAEATWQEVRRILTGDHPSIDFETRLQPKDGPVRLLSWRAVGSPEEGRVYAVGRDISERRVAEERLMRAQRLEAVGQLTGGIAHDFNNILAALLSYIEVARRSPDPQKAEKALKAAADTGRRGAALVSQLLTFARKQQLALTPVDVNKLLRGLQDLLQRTLGGTVSVHYDLAPDIYDALADSTQLEMVVMNLAINARDAMPEGGTLRVATRPWAITDDPGSRIDDMPSGDYLVLSVQDTGTGMDEAALARCFEPFYTTKAPGRGTGLGLPQVLGVIQQCGGTVRIHSQPGQGTTVDVVLRRAQTESEGHAPVDQPPPSLPSGAVLVVDDDPDVLMSTTYLLEACGFQPIAAEGADEAMRILLEARPIDVMLTDYAMPGMNGVELLRNAVRYRPKLAGIVVSGHHEFAAVRRQMPAVAVLRKPFDANQLAEAIESAINMHRLHTGEH